MGIIRNSLNEVRLRDIKGIPNSFLDLVDQYANVNLDISQEEAKEMFELLNFIQKTQQGHHAKLSELSEKIIRDFYGELLDDVKLDLKVVNPNDEEKMEMVQKMAKDEDDFKIEQPEIESEDYEEDPDPNEVAKRKILNNLMQGEAQNVHSMIYSVKDELDEIHPKLADAYIKFLNLNKKFDWKGNLPEAIKNAPQLANASEVDWEGGDDEEDGELTPVIKARGLDLPIVVHEAVKGLYELIASNNIDVDPVMAQKIMAKTDTLDNEQEDIRYGPFIAASVRDYVNECVDSVSGANDIPNIREFIFGEMVNMPAEEFLDLIEAILTDDQSKKSLIKEYINKVKKDFDEYELRQHLDMDDEDDYDEDDDSDIDSIDSELEDLLKQSNIGEPSEESPSSEIRYEDMHQSDLQKLLDDALDTGNYKKAEEIAKYINEDLNFKLPLNMLVRESLSDFIKEHEITADTKTKPTTKPGVRPGRSKPSPIRRDKPSVNPKPKASLEDVVKRFIKLVNLK